MTIDTFMNLRLATKEAGKMVSNTKTCSSILKTALSSFGALVLVVGASVGLAAVLGTVRFLYGWSLKPLIYIALGPVLLMAWGSTDPFLLRV